LRFDEVVSGAKLVRFVRNLDLDLGPLVGFDFGPLSYESRGQEFESLRARQNATI